MAQIDFRDVELLLPCPSCGYELFCLASEVQAGIFLRCPACRKLIQLHDSGASITVVEAELEAALRELLKGF